MGGTAPTLSNQAAAYNNGVTPTHLQQRSAHGLAMQAQAMSYNGPPSGVNSGLGGSLFSLSKQAPMAAAADAGGEKLTAYQRRQLEKQRQASGMNVGGGASGDGQMSIEDRLARLKAIHQKPVRPPSGQRKLPHRGQTVQTNRIPQPLDPVEFQRQIEQRTAEEKAKLDEFKKHEAKMKEYQKAKKNAAGASRPPLAHTNTQALTKDTSHADL